ncbi:MAG TPA: GTPase ObgE [Thermodesulfobacteriota bacterium]|nr:GTPase ObgE [Thermodesulfobacteriota bacterium]
MNFIDEAKIYVKAGDGGRGCISFRREKFVPKGGPDGGNGGRGGDVLVRAEARMTSLIDLRYRKHYKGERGEHGMGSGCHGKNGMPVIIKVPVGTIVKELSTGDVLCDITKDGEEFVLAKAGRGGKGNAHFATATRQAPRFAQPGEPGEEKELKFELKLLADVAIIGFPNAGKSTLISHISHAKPKIADYPFTTLVPHLGVVKFGEFGGFVVADIPGLIQGAHEGKGLGTRFLKHIERTRLLVHLLDLSPETGRDPKDDFKVVNKELKLFNNELADRPQVVALNKTDIAGAKEKSAKLLKFFSSKCIKVFPVSSVTGAGLKELVDFVGERVEKMKQGKE